MCESALLLPPPALWKQKHTDLWEQKFAQPPDLWHQHRVAKISFAWSWRLCEINTSVPTPCLTGRSTTEKQRYSFEGSSFKGIPGSGSAWVEYILINCVVGCLEYLNRIWSRDCSVHNKFGYHWSLPCYNLYLCPWNINEFTCFIFYPLTVTRTWTRSNEIYTLLFNIILVLQINPPP